MMGMMQWGVLALYLVIAVAVIALARADKRLDRGAYLWRVLLMFAVSVVGNAIAAHGGPGSPMGQEAPLLIPLVMVVSFAVYVVFLLGSVHRTNALGWNRWLCLLLLVPFVNLVFVIVLLLRPTPEREMAWEEAEAENDGDPSGRDGQG